MKKSIFLTLISIFFIGFAQSQVKNLVVDAKFDPNTSGIYTYWGKFNNRNMWLGPKTTNRNYLSYSKFANQWVIGTWYNDTNQMWSDMYYSNNTGNDPIGSWGSSLDVSYEGPGLKYTVTNFKETSSNDGAIEGMVSIAHNKFNGQTFAGQDGDDFVAKNYVTISNLNAGLSATLIRRSDSTLELSLSGKSTVHNVDTSFDIAFTDNAFTNGGKADSTAGATNKFVINFINVWTVGATGADFNNIDTAFKTAQNDDIIKVAEGTYTGMVKVISNLTSFQLIGEGPNKTIFQADSVPGTAKGRVFELGSVQNAYFEGITIQNGHDTSNNSYGGGISLSSGNLTLKNCRVINNWAISRGQGQTVGGGIYCGRDLKIIQSEIANNVCDNRVKQGQIQGGAFFAGGHCIIENSTISGNFSRSTGGAGLLGNNSMNKSAHRIINSTITNNEAGGEGGALNTYYETVIANSIIYGNKATKAKDIFQTNSHVYTMGITNSFIGDMSGFQDKVKITGTPLTTDPKLDTLAFNCGYTRTHALLDGSPAIDGGVMGDTIRQIDQRGFSAFQTIDIGAHEQVYQLQFSIGRDSICMESTELLTLNGIPNNGTFEGIGVTGNQFDPSKVSTDGYVTITYKYNAPGCDNFSSSDSIYVYKCEVNNSVERNQLNARIYPNPAFDVLWIENNQQMNMNAQITDLSGKTLIRLTDKNQLISVDINELPAGVYLLNLESMGMKSVQKFVKLQN